MESHPAHKLKQSKKLHATACEERYFVQKIFPCLSQWDLLNHTEFIHLTNAKSRHSLQRTRKHCAVAIIYRIHDRVIVGIEQNRVFAPTCTAHVKRERTPKLRPDYEPNQK